LLEKYATESRPTPAGSRPGCGRCADCAENTPCTSLRQVTRSCRTCVADTTELAIEHPAAERVRVAFAELAGCV
jgi:hypothetical protein